MNGDTQKTGPNTETASNGPSTGADFLSLFCEKFGCARRKFEKRLFLACVYPHGVVTARIIRLVNPRLFKADFALIEQIKHATSFAEVKRLVDFHGAQNSPVGLFRLILKVRLSKQRMLHLAQTLFASSP